MAKDGEGSRGPAMGSGRRSGCGSDDAEIGEYFSGRRLVGDDFGPDQVRAWVEDEREAYVKLLPEDRSPQEYPYHALNVQHGFRFLPRRPFPRALGFGSAHGEEFVPILRLVKDITIVEPSKAFARSEIHGVPVSYVRPPEDGTIPFPRDSFDLVTCFGVLHHIPNVSHVVREFYRCLRPGGYALVREPIRSMGDWRKPRPGLTKRERGIPVDLFRRIVAAAGFETIHEAHCLSSFVYGLERLAGWPVYRLEPVVIGDVWVSAVLRSNVTYHPTNALERMGPTALFLVLRKRDGVPPALTVTPSPRT